MTLEELNDFAKLLDEVRDKPNVDYREIYKGIDGACASCRHIASLEPGLQGNYIPWDGSKKGYCSKPGNGGASIGIGCRLRPDLPPIECWEQR